MSNSRSSSSRPRRRRRLGPLRLTITVLLCAVAAIAGTWTVSTYLSQQAYPEDMRGNAVILPGLSEAVKEKTDAVSQVQRMTLRVPSTGLSVPLGELNEVDGVIDPPGFSSAYLVRNFGVSLDRAAVGTVFAVMHSCRGGAVCPGNYLIDVNKGTASVATGADVYLGGLHYRVTGSKKVYKPDVHADTDIWANIPGRLVLLTCLQVPSQTASIDNMVITAQLDG